MEETRNTEFRPKSGRPVRKGSEICTRVARFPNVCGGPLRDSENTKKHPCSLQLGTLVRCWNVDFYFFHVTEKKETDGSSSPGGWLCGLSDKRVVTRPCLQMSRLHSQSILVSNLFLRQVYVEGPRPKTDPYTLASQTKHTHSTTPTSHPSCRKKGRSPTQFTAACQREPGRWVINSHSRLLLAVHLH